MGSDGDVETWTTRFLSLPKSVQRELAKLAKTKDSNKNKTALRGGAVTKKKTTTAAAAAKSMRSKSKSQAAKKKRPQRDDVDSDSDVDVSDSDDGGDDKKAKARTCGVCHEAIGAKEAKTRLACHTFHDECIEWWNRPEQPGCPVCRPDGTTRTMPCGHKLDVSLDINKDITYGAFCAPCDRFFYVSRSGEIVGS
jgi:hypothetical protein